MKTNKALLCLPATHADAALDKFDSISTELKK